MLQRLQSAPIGLGGPGAVGLATLTLWRREMVRFFRQRHRVVSALFTPVVLWVLLGSGLNSVFVLPTEDPAARAAGTVGTVGTVGYRQYFFAGTLTMILLFTAIFSTITVIEDRREGFLQGVLVAPVPRGAIALGKILGGAFIAMIHSILFLLLWPLVASGPAVSTGPGAMAAAAGVCLLMAIGLAGLGLCIAWPMDSVAGFHAIMMLFLMPMWFLSGAVFPMQGAAGWMKALMWFDPMTYGQAALSAALRNGQTGTPMMAWQATLATAALAVAAVALAGVVVGRSNKEAAP